MHRDSDDSDDSDGEDYKKHVEKDEISQVKRTWDEDQSNPATPVGHFQWQTNQKQEGNIDQQMLNPGKSYRLCLGETLSRGIVAFIYFHWQTSGRPTKSKMTILTNKCSNVEVGRGGVF